MKTIDIKEVVSKAGLDFNKTAKLLFPGNKHPRLALNRVISGESELTMSQISKLSTLSGIAISELFEGKWKSTSRYGVYTFEHESFIAELDLDKRSTKISDKDSIFHETVLHSPSITLPEYIKMINTEIINYKNSKK